MKHYDLSGCDDDDHANVIVVHKYIYLFALETRK